MRKVYDSVEDKEILFFGNFIEAYIKPDKKFLELYDSIENYKNIKNKLDKKVILNYLTDYIENSGNVGYASWDIKDIYTGERIQRMYIRDGDFSFTGEFWHHYKNYDIGIPLEYEEYIKKKLNL